MDAPPPDGRPRPSLRLLTTAGAGQVNQPVPINTGRPSDDHGGSGLTDLMQKVAHGDKEAFSALYDALAPMVFGIVVKVLRDRAQSEEVSQEVMIDLWRQAARYR
ncbi:RNA polymerase subunit sigma, partial [Streptomyces sp. SID7760]|nr:RNA polymerase subunit sigma [Streptomyces sp. SID7760]